MRDRICVLQHIILCDSADLSSSRERAAESSQIENFGQLESVWSKEQ